MRSPAEIPFPGLPPASPEAAAYGERADALGRSTGLDPVKELRYGEDANQRLHVYVPANIGRDALPVVTFFHGGAWVSGGLSWLRFMAPAVTALPAIFVAGTYRLAPTWQWPAQYDDVSTAIACAHEHAASLGGNPARMIVGGHSAGGHLAALAVLKREIPQVRACFPVSSSFDLQYGDVALDSPEGRVYKYLFSHRQQDIEASPISFVNGNRTPFHVVWGANDFARITRTSERMVRALQEAGTPVSSSVVPDAGHFDTHLQLADPGNLWYARLREEFQHA